MLIVKVNPVGIDRTVQHLQTGLHKLLVAAWGITANDSVYRCYGRVYRNRRDLGYVAEVFKGQKDYEEVYWNDNLSALSFFTVSDRQEYQKGESKTAAAAIFFVNLSKLKPTIAHRADEEVRQDVIKFFQSQMISLETGIDNVLREFPVTRDRLIAADMQPVHCFRVNLMLKYKNC